MLLMKSNNFSFILLSLLALSCNNGNKNQDVKSSPNSNFNKPSKFFPKPKAKVLLVGTFHMNYPNLDAIKITDEDKIDVLKEPKKSEITEVVNYLKKFEPTKVAVEKSTKWNKNIIKRYQDGEFNNNRDEAYQLGARIASEMNHDTIYGINSWSMYSDLKKLDSTYVKRLFKDYDYSNDAIYSASAKKWFGHQAKLISKTNLLKYLKNINTIESHGYGFGIYLTGDFKLGKSRGADALSINWINRNLRILRNIQDMAQNGDRIIVVIGNGHASILRQFIEASPEFEFVEFDSL